jgi:two-component system cell cycle response regulator CpdR
LYVEDNPLVREVTCELLEQAGRKIVALSSAEEALEAFRSNPYDLVITDVSLPIMSGVDLARTLLRDKPMLPIIIASGYSLEPGGQSWGRQVRTIIKPFEIDEIDALILELTGPRA